LLALGLFENYYFKNVGAIQIRKSDGKKRSKHGTHGICSKKKEGKKQEVCHIVALDLPGTVFYKFCHLQ